MFNECLPLQLIDKILSLKVVLPFVIMPCRELKVCGYWMMNGLSFKELCCLFCCPPCPARIAAKLAFLPPEPTYSFGGPKLSVDGDSNAQSPQLLTFRLTDRSEWQYSQTELDMIDVFMARSARGNRVACAYVRASPNAKFTLLFSHGNAVDLGQMSSFYVGLAMRINCNIFR